MKKLLHYVLSVIVSAVCFFPVTDFQNINNKADSAEATEISDYTVEDLENLKNFLLCKSLFSIFSKREKSGIME